MFCCSFTTTEWYCSLIAKKPRKMYSKMHLNAFSSKFTCCSEFQFHNNLKPNDMFNHIKADRIRGEFLTVLYRKDEHLLRTINIISIEPPMQ